MKRKSNDKTVNTEGEVIKCCNNKKISKLPRRRLKADKRRRRSRRSSHRPRTLRGSSPTPKTGSIIYRASRLIIE
jgi:hypothetical protein